MKQFLQVETFHSLPENDAYILDALSDILLH